MCQCEPSSHDNLNLGRFRRNLGRKPKLPYPIVDFPSLPCTLQPAHSLWGSSHVVGEMRI